GRRRYVYWLLPVSRPEVINTSKGPAIVHSSDYSTVSAANPAKAGETLVLYANGLGPTRPGVDPGRPSLQHPFRLSIRRSRCCATEHRRQSLSPAGSPVLSGFIKSTFKFPIARPPVQWRWV